MAAKGMDDRNGGICVFSGGTAANFLVDVFNKIADKKQCHLTYIIPISDNGGSSSELIRVFGGPSVGDIRSRLVRLIPDNGDEERSAVKALFEHRLPSDPAKARAEWLAIVEASHLLWTFISSPKRELIRSVLNTLNMEILKRSRPTLAFDFARASVGNLFLTGARLFTGSFEAAIYLLSLLCSIPEHISVLPAINSNFTHHISASLADGTSIAGQVNISHPSAPTALPDAPGGSSSPHDRRAEQLAAPHDPSTEDATPPGSLPTLRGAHIAFSKSAEAPLPARIARVWYINPYGHEIWPVANPKVVGALRTGCTAVVFSIGSLYTSIMPSVVLRGVGRAVGEAAGIRRKILILNGTLDRETGPAADPMTAVDFVLAIVRGAKESAMDETPVGNEEVRRYITHLICLGDGDGPEVDREELVRLGVCCVVISGKKGKYDVEDLTEVLESILES